jgi:hypothetical protein
VSVVSGVERGESGGDGRTFVGRGKEGESERGSSFCSEPRGAHPSHKNACSREEPENDFRGSAGSNVEGPRGQLRGAECF